jgi:hypothetical protein
MSSARTGLLIEASDVVAIDADARALHGVMVCGGFDLRPWARARFVAGGRVRARLVWRCRAFGKTATMEVTFKSGDLR